MWLALGYILNIIYFYLSINYDSSSQESSSICRENSWKASGYEFKVLFRYYVSNLSPLDDLNFVPQKVASVLKILSIATYLNVGTVIAYNRFTDVLFG